MEGDEVRERLFMLNMRGLSDMAYEAIQKERYLPTDFVLICLKAGDRYADEIMNNIPELQTVLLNAKTRNDVSVVFRVLAPFGTCETFASLFPQDEIAAEIMELPEKGTVKCIVVAADGISVRYIHPAIDRLH